MIKKYLNFVKENVNEEDLVVDQGEVDSDPETCIQITPEEESLFNTEPVLQSLIDQRKVTYQSGELCYPKDDQKVIDILSNYFKNIKANESVNEMFDLGDSPDPLNGHKSYHLRRDTKLACDAWEAGEKFCSGNGPDFETWWKDYHQSL